MLLCRPNLYSRPVKITAVEIVRPCTGSNKERRDSLSDQGVRKVDIGRGNTHSMKFCTSLEFFTISTLHNCAEMVLGTLMNYGMSARNVGFVLSTSPCSFSRRTSRSILIPLSHFPCSLAAHEYGRGNPPGPRSSQVMAFALSISSITTHHLSLCDLMTC